MWNWIKGLFRKKEKPVKKNELFNMRVGTGRRRNIIYPVDELAEQHIEESLDEVFWKHHG